MVTALVSSVGGVQLVRRNAGRHRSAVGAVVLGESLGPLDWVAIGLIVTANAVALAGQTSTTTDSPPAARRPERMVAASSTAPAHNQAVT